MKKRIITAGILSFVMTVTAVFPTAVFAGEPQNDLTYAEMFKSLYDDVITNGRTNGYFSAPKNNYSFALPYHAIEEFCVDDVDYGHETTSNDAAYLVQVAALHDVLVKQGRISGSADNIVKSWGTLEEMIPCSANYAYGSDKIKGILWKPEEQKSDSYPDGENPDDYPIPTTAFGSYGKNPLYNILKTAYSSDGGYYITHRLIDTDDWYGFGEGSSAYINLFQRGVNESCYETVPQPCLEEFKYGNETCGIRGIIIGNSVAPQYIFNNDPSADFRAIQAIHLANRWSIDTGARSALAGKMGDQLRNVMFDRFYKQIGCQNLSSASESKAKSQHYLISGETQLYGPLNEWVWGSQTSGLDIHQADQNPLAAYALLTDSNMSDAMKASMAADDYKESLKRQIELYLWLQSREGPIAGGCTNSYKGKYEKYNSSDPTFYDMVYVEHPNHKDPGSNQSISSQAQTVQRLAELYYYIKTTEDKSGIHPGYMSLEEALDTLLGRWFDWIEANTHFDWEAPDGTSYTYCIPTEINWTGQPDTWSGYYYPNGNQNLHASIADYGQDVGSVSAICNALTYYAAAKGVNVYASVSDQNTTTEAKGLRLANKLLRCQWAEGRDEVGISVKEHNSELSRVFDQEVYIPENYSGEMPDGSALKSGATFSSIRKKYNNVQGWKDALAYYMGIGSDNNHDGVININDYEYKMHKFKDESDAVMAYGTMALLYPEATSSPRPFNVDFVTEPYYPDPATQTVNGGETASIPIIPDDCAGKHIVGWHADDDLSNLFDFKTPITRDTMFCAVWQDINNTIVSSSDKTFITYYGDDINLTMNGIVNGSVACKVTLDGVNIPCKQSRTTFTVAAKAIPAGETAEVEYTVTSGARTNVYKYNVKSVYKCGDIDGSGTVDNNDAELYLHILSGKFDFTEDQLRCADVNYDGKWDILDPIAIIK